MRKRRSARGKLHFVLNDKENTAACGIGIGRVETTSYKEIVNCVNCRCTKAFMGAK